MNAVSRAAGGMILPFPSRSSARQVEGRVLAVVGGPLDASVLDLAQVIAEAIGGAIDLLHLVEVPPTLPMLAYGRMVQAQGNDTVLDAALAACDPCVGEVATLLCRHSGPALVAEVAARGSSALVLATPTGGWWARRRGRRTITHTLDHAACPVYVVHSPQPQQTLLPRAAAR